MPDEIIIRPIEYSDNKIIEAIIKNTLIEYNADKPGTAFFDKSLCNMFDAYKNNTDIYYIAILNGIIVGGCGIAALDNDLNICELQKMYITPIARYKRIGKKLMDSCLDFAIKKGYRQCYLETFSTMNDALNLYKKSGFYYISKPIGVTGHDACDNWLIKDLKQ